MRANSAPYFCLRFAYVIAAISAFEHFVYEVRVGHIFTVKFFHKKSMSVGKNFMLFLYFFLQILAFDYIIWYNKKNRLTNILRYSARKIFRDF